MKMPIKEQVKSKGMIGGYFMIGLGIWLLSQNHIELGLSQIGMGFGILGIRDAK